jgi:hypothetical protein
LKPVKSIRECLRGNDPGPSVPKLAFLHIPKTGGTFLTQAESDGQPVVGPIQNLGHVTILDNDSDFDLDVAKPYSQTATMRRIDVDQYLVFSNVRNTFAFFVSYMFHSGGLNPKYRDDSHYDYVAANKGLDYLIKTIADRDTLWPSRRFINYMLFSQPRGDLITDWINYSETLDSDLIEMATYYGLRYRSMPKQRVSGYHDYRPYYKSALVDFVNDTWNREVLIFGFNFEKPNIWRGREKVLKLLRNSSYQWRTDTFLSQTVKERFRIGLYRNLRRKNGFPFRRT